MGVPPPWARKFYFPFVPFEISSQESCSDTSGGFQEGAQGLDFLLFLDLTEAQRSQGLDLAPDAL